MKDDYRIIRSLGKGGMSRVFLAVDRRIARKWTIKEICCNDKEYILNSIYREVSLLKEIENDRIAKIVDVYSDDNNVFLVMEYIEGTALSDICRERPAFAARMARRWVIEIAEILDELHSMSPPVIYWDLKPSNIIVKSNGKLSLIDFGAAKIKSDEPKDIYPTGTVNYSAPEQLEGYTDELTDIYSFGKTIEKLSSNDIFIKKIVSDCIKEDRNERPQSINSILRRLRLHRNIKYYGVQAAVIIIILAAAVIYSANIYCRKKTEAESYHFELTKEKLERLDRAAPEELASVVGEMDAYSESCEKEERSRIKYSCAKKALIELNDYELAHKYLCELDTDTYPDVKYLRIISEELSKFSDEPERLNKTLIEYKKYIENNENGEQKKDDLAYVASLLVLEAERRQ